MNEKHITKLIKIAASLHWNKAPELKHQYSFKVPNYHIKTIQDNNQSLNCKIIELRSLADSIQKESDNRVKEVLNRLMDQPRASKQDIFDELEKLDGREI